MSCEETSGTNTRNGQVQLQMDYFRNNNHCAAARLLPWKLRVTAWMAGNTAHACVYAHEAGKLLHTQNLTSRECSLQAQPEGENILITYVRLVSNTS